MSSTKNTQVIYKKIPHGIPDPDSDFEIAITGKTPEDVTLSANQILIRTLYLSLDPYMRPRLRDPSIQSYFPPMIPGTCVAGGVIGEVMRSTDQRYKPGDVVVAFSTWEEYSVVQTDNYIFGEIFVIPSPRESIFPLSYYLSVLGIIGISAYMGLHEVCEPLTPGQTLFVSCAAGAVGQVVGQYAKTLGLRVVGSTGSDAKVHLLVNELGFDAAFNYKTNPDFVSILREKCPEGIDICFENVGGKMLDAVLEVANNNCRISLCGMISQYNNTEGQHEPIFNTWNVITKRIKMQGFICLDKLDKYGEITVKTFAKLLVEKKMVYKETVTEGIANAPHAFVGMLQGKNVGKAIVKVADL